MSSLNSFVCRQANRCEEETLHCMCLLDGTMLQSGSGCLSLSFSRRRRAPWTTYTSARGRSKSCRSSTVDARRTASFFCQSTCPVRTSCLLTARCEKMQRAQSLVTFESESGAAWSLVLETSGGVTWLPSTVRANWVILQTNNQVLSFSIHKPRGASSLSKSDRQWIQILTRPFVCLLTALIPKLCREFGSINRLPVSVVPGLLSFQ